MRLHLVIAAGLMLAFGLQLKADTLSQEAFSAEEPSSRLIAEQGWNRWTCTARSLRGFRFYRGQSYLFRPGSGEGQDAKRVARLMALRECEFRNRFSCQSRMEADCSVQRINQ